MANPDLARQEAEVTKARYGGSSIQDTAPPPYAEPKTAGGVGVKPLHDRGRFEGEVYKELGGNPFEINVVKQMNDISARDLPRLFSSVFKGQAVWEDRNKLNKKQADFWQAQVQGYRAHVKESLEAERKTKIDVYNHMMKTFDNDTKEQEAAEKRVGEREKEWATQRKDASKESLTEQKDTQKRLTEMQKDKRDILKRQSEIIKNNTDLTTGQLAKEAEAEFMELANQLKMINGESEKILMATSPEHRAKRAKESVPDRGLVPSHGGVVPGAGDSAPGKPQQGTEQPAGSPAKSPAAAPQAKATAESAKYKPHPKGKPAEVRRHKNGKLIGKFEDGSIAWLDEV
jgi:hypothetical protein